ncbi:DUF3575 domain-containing protein [uncultured Bacteroides sp.]|uniref:DUF3575 domain-containing protein n=1 Tax=uncultured Bacteroides sp. TaxID=162156 RepID=UPI00280AB0ED|nr:DUF3575 domain-containing protein [uncultured Bacteroides sp.]
MSYGTNQKELKRLFSLIERYRAILIEDISIPIYVDGYCCSLSAVRDNLAVAKVRSNRVKSELITRMGLKEENFVTRNHTNRIISATGKHPKQGDRVVVRIHIPVSAIPVTSAKLSTSVAPVVSRLSEIPISESSLKRDKDGSFRFALKTNLLYITLLLINAEAEYYLKKRLSLNIDWQYAWWSRRSKHRYYRVAAVSPELRYWFASKDNFRGHFGGFYLGTGLYEFMARPACGIQGEFFIAGGLTYGYMFPVGKRLRMELSLGIGYLMTEYRRYHWDRGCYVYEKTQRYSYFGPTKAKVSLVWPLNLFKRKPRMET